MSYSMSDLLQLVVSEGSSDLHLRVGIPPTIRVHGILHRVEGPTLTPEDTEELMRSITSEEHIQQVRERGGADFAFAFGEAARFRVSVFKEKGNFGMVLRQIPTKLLELDKIGLDLGWPRRAVDDEDQRVSMQDGAFERLVFPPRFEGAAPHQKIIRDAAIAVEHDGLLRVRSIGRRE